MNSDNIHIKTVFLKDLKQFASGFADKSDFDRIIPITLPRAGAQAKNPYANPEDAVLFVAFNNNRIIGYLGRFPGLLSFENKHWRIFWGSTFYLMDKYRGKGLGQLLLDKMISLNQDFIVTRITPPAKSVLKSYGMAVLGSLDYFQLRVEKVHCFKGLFEAFKKFDKGPDDKNHGNRKLGKKLEESLYKMEKYFFYLAISGLVHKMAGYYKFRVTDHIKKSDFFEHQESDTPFFYRGPELINWMLQEKWVISKFHTVAEKSGYYFSNIRDLFTYIPVKLYHRTYQNYVGFIILSVSSHKGKTVLKVLDHSLKTNDIISAACAVVLKYARKYLADRVELSSKMGDYLINYMIFKSFLKMQKRDYLYFPADETSPLERSKEKIRFDYCDGDTAFT